MSAGEHATDGAENDDREDGDDDAVVIMLAHRMPQADHTLRLMCIPCPRIEGRDNRLHVCSFGGALLGWVGVVGFALAHETQWRWVEVDGGQ